MAVNLFLTWNRIFHTRVIVQQQAPLRFREEGLKFTPATFYSPTQSPMQYH